MMDTGGNQVGTLAERLARTRLVLGRERDEAPGLCAELLGRAPAAQRETADRDARFHTWGVCELLLARAAAVAEVEPPESGRLARLGLALTERLDLGLHASAVVADLKARLWAAAGEAARREGEVRQAEEALGASAACLAHGTGDLLLDAQLLEFEAAVREDQGRAGEADSLLKQAAARYAALHEDDLHARVLAKRGHLRRPGEAAQPVVSLGYETIR